MAHKVDETKPTKQSPGRFVWYSLKTEKVHRLPIQSQHQQIVHYPAKPQNILGRLKKKCERTGCQRSITDEWEYVNICNRNPTFELGYFLFKIHHNDRLERYQYGQGRLTSKRCVMCVKSRKWVFFLYFWWLRVWRSPSFAYTTVINKVA